MADVPTLALPGGDQLPLVAYGTSSHPVRPGSDSIAAALDAGYTCFDTAEGYGTEATLGEVLASANRERLFLTSKVLPKHQTYDALIAACEDSLDRLDTEYFDLYLLHWPNPAISLRESLAALETLHDRGLVRNVGVSNFSAYLLSCALHVADVPIAVNQIEHHPWFQRPELVEFCRDRDVVVQAAAPLGGGRILDDPVVRRLADEYERSPAQMALKWAVDRGVAVVTKSTTPAHVRGNIELFDWNLSDADRRALDEQDRTDPGYTPRVGRDWDDDTYGIAE